jgi:uncharacterized membrane protein YgcG
MDLRLETTLIECLGLLEQGESVDAILARYPEDSEQLRVLLQVATALPAMRVEPTPAAQASSRRAFLNQAHELSERSGARRSWFLPRLAIGLAALVLAFLFVGGTVAASATALPDETLYSVKRAVEDTRLIFASQETKASLADEFQQRRRDEIGKLLGDRRAATVAFDGQIDALQPAQWVISGLTVRVDRATSVTGTPLIQARAHVQARTDNGELIATVIQIDPGTGLPPTATPTFTPIPTATATATPSPIPTATATSTPIPTATSTPAPTATEPPTRVPTRVPVRQPTLAPPAPTVAPPDDNANGNDNVNGNDDHGGDNGGGGGGGTNDNVNGNDNHGGDNGGSGGGGTNDNVNGNDDHGGSGGGGDSGGSGGGGSGGGGGSDSGGSSGGSGGGGGGDSGGSGGGGGGGGGSDSGGSSGGGGGGGGSGGGGGGGGGGDG